MTIWTMIVVTGAPKIEADARELADPSRNAENQTSNSTQVINAKCLAAFDNNKDIWGSPGRVGPYEAPNPCSTLAVQIASARFEVLM